MDKDLNIGLKTVKLLKENTGKNLLETGLSNDFFGYDNKSTSKKSKSKQVALHGTKKASAQKKKQSIQ